jgi:phosphopantetheine adenylyltransferase
MDQNYGCGVAPKLDIGCVHGRFQPFHNEHLEYVGRAYELCRLLYIGITHSIPGVGGITEAAPHRHTCEANPFSFTERMELILASLEDVGYDLSRVRVVPFPVENPSLIGNYVPSRAVHLLSPCDEWQIEKYHNLLLAGFSVQWVIGSRKGIQASSVRSLIRKGLSVNRIVPPPVAQFLRILQQDSSGSSRTARALFHS